MTSTGFDVRKYRWHVLMYLVYGGLCLYLFKQAEIGLHFAALVLVFSLGLFGRRYRVFVLAVLSLTAAMIIAQLYTAKLMGGANLFKLIPDLVAIVADTNSGEIRTAIGNFGSCDEVLGLVLLVLGSACFVALGGIQLPLGLRRSFVAVSVLAFVGLAVSHRFMYWRTYDGLIQLRQVYAQNIDRIRAKEKFVWNATSAYDGKDTVVLVLGEETRGDHMGVNGYPRDTTPGLGREKHLISYPDVISNAPSTLLSTPIILTRSRGEIKTRIWGEKSLIAAFNEAGYASYYVSYLRKVHYGDNAINQLVSDAQHYRNSAPAEGELEDLAGVQRVTEIIDGPEQKKLIVLKLIGSHFDVKDRFNQAFNVFKPSYLDVEYDGLKLSDKQVLVNSYDNSIRVTDAVVTSIIHKLKQTAGRTSLSFISDHGTTLYDDGKTVLRSAARWTYSIPLMFWLKPGYFDSEKRASLMGNRNASVDSTCFLDTFLSINDIVTPMKKGCDLTAGPIKPYIRTVISRGRMVDFDRAFADQASSGGASSVGIQ